MTIEKSILKILKKTFSASLKLKLATFCSLALEQNTIFEGVTKRCVCCLSIHKPSNKPFPGPDLALPSSRSFLSSQQMRSENKVLKLCCRLFTIHPKVFTSFFILQQSKTVLCWHQGEGLNFCLAVILPCTNQRPGAADPACKT